MKRSRENKIRVGVLGCANIAVRSLIPAFHEHPTFEFHALASRDKAKAAAIASKYSAKPCNYEQLVEDANIDLIYIPLPAGLHKIWVTEALKHGKHVLCEKSLGVSLPEVEEMTAAARTARKALIENFQFQYHSQQRFIKNLLKDGALGEIRCFRSSFGFPPFADAENIRYKKALGGGALLDAGAYTIKATQFFLEDEFAVTAARLIKTNYREVDVYGGGFLEGASGQIAEIAFGFDNFYQCNIEIWGSEGKLSANRVFTAPPGFSPEIIVETPKETKRYRLEADNHFEKMLDHVAESIENEDYEADYAANYSQAQLIQQFKNICDEK
jgi:predicted dehydrogenase